jgi:hypothetical protein
MTCNHISQPEHGCPWCRIAQLEAALTQCLEYIELDSETPMFICDAWDLLKGSSKKAIALLSAAEREFDKIAMANGGEPQFLIHCQIRDWLDEVTAVLSSQSDAEVKHGPESAP